MTPINNKSFFITFLNLLLLYILTSGVSINVLIAFAGLIVSAGCFHFDFASCFTCLAIACIRGFFRIALFC